MVLTVCNKTISVRAGKMQLHRHMEIAMHQRLSKSTKKQANLLDVTKSLVNQDEFKKRADLYLAAYVAEHNLSFNLINHLPSLIKVICPEYENAKKIQCHRTKCTAIIKNVLGKYQLQLITQCLRTTTFSLIVDESTDKGCTKHLGIIVRYFNGEKLLDDIFIIFISFYDLY